MKSKGVTYAVILAGGIGERMGASVPKQELLLLGKSILERSIEAFARAKTVDGIVVVVREGEEAYAEKLLSRYTLPTLVVKGGATRGESAGCGVSNAPCEYVAIHDAVRPLIHPDDIDKVVKAAWEHGCASAVSPVFDTVKEVDSEGRILRTHPRESLRLATTPQVFSKEIYCRALNAVGEDARLTDDNMLIEAVGGSVITVMTDHINLKITTREDLMYAEYLLGGKENE